MHLPLPYLQWVRLIWSALHGKRRDSVSNACNIAKSRTGRPPHPHVNGEVGGGVFGSRREEPGNGAIIIVEISRCDYYVEESIVRDDTTGDQVAIGPGSAGRGLRQGH